MRREPPGVGGRGSGRDQGIGRIGGGPCGERGGSPLPAAAGHTFESRLDPRHRIPGLYPALPGILGRVGPWLQTGRAGAGIGQRPHCESSRRAYHPGLVQGLRAVRSQPNRPARRGHWGADGWRRLTFRAIPQHLQGDQRAERRDPATGFPGRWPRIRPPARC